MLNYSISDKNLTEYISGKLEIPALFDGIKVGGYPEEIEEFIAEILGEKEGSEVIISDTEVVDIKGFSISKGDKFSLVDFLDLKYQRVERVWEEGDISLLGDVVIFWPFSMQNVIRISLEDNIVERIDIVDASTRAKKKSVKQIDLFNKGSSIVVGREGRGKRIILKRTRDSLEKKDLDLQISFIPGVDIFSNPKSTEQVIANYKKRGFEILYLTPSIERFERERSLLKKQIDTIFKGKGSVESSLGKGFVLNNEKIVVLTNFEVLGEVDLSIYDKKGRDLDRGSIAILKKILPGDYVVHIDHGIGVFKGIISKDNGEYLKIKYAKEDKLFVPLRTVGKVSKYIGAGKRRPVLTGLDSGVWKRISKRAKERAEDIAKELIQLYAMREISIIDPILNSGDELNDFYKFVESFEFNDTDDQILITRQLLDDLQSTNPMDRLLVGDVGFGKTELALRAIFATVNAGYQVAVLAPTTILVQQHLEVFKRRFKGYPFEIRSLSRFSTAMEKEETTDLLKEGKVDIVIGTHSLISGRVKFKNLGLLIIDEEQKFGVKQKEKLKEARVNTNILSLTATPIPRTLNMALSGVRDISVLATPPEGRREVVNRVEKFSWDMVFKAIEQELKRKGQVYFLHNRVGNIEGIYDRLRRLFPQSRIAIAHGQMGVQRLSNTMADFIKGDIDILLCTTIIENGLDIQSANTLIIDDCTSLGLAQMYQIKGRIGREKRQAYAWFFYDLLKGDLALRLSAIKESQALGSGFILSNRDLEIRGAGDILGKEQSGAINSVGYGLYTRMLKEAVERLRESNRNDDKY